jgi:predicted CXXCH cytochrome family protein
MANVVTNPQQHPDAVLPDFTKADPLLTFKLSDVAFVYGSKWKQRYFKKVGDDYFPLPAQWDVTHRVWRPYVVQPNTDWWVPFYPGGNDQRPTESVMYRRGVACFSCHDVHGTSNNTDTIKPARDLCLTCHNPGSTNGPHNVATIEHHTHHRAGSAGDECVACHMPQIETPIFDVSVRSHTFQFIAPSMTDAYKIPNPRTTCHKDKTTAWARDAMGGWSNVSHWRVE